MPCNGLIPFPSRIGKCRDLLGTNDEHASPVG